MTVVGPLLTWPTDAQLIYKPSPIQQYQNCFYNTTHSGRSRAQNLCRLKEQTQTNEQKTNTTLLVAPALGEVRAPPNLTQRLRTSITFFLL